MKESLVGRVGRILSGSINAVIDAVETSAPELVMEQAIREIDDAIQDVRVELGQIVANKHLSNKRLMEENQKHEDLTDKIGLAIKESRDDLAEAAIAQQIDIESQIPVLERAITDAVDKENELESYIQALKAKKREMGNELKNFIDARKESNVSVSDDGSVYSSSTTIDKVEKAQAAFNRIMESSTGIASSNNVNAADMKKLAELDEMSRKNRISERLLKLKSDNS